MAANTIGRQVVSLRDAKGQMARMVFYIHYDNGAATNDAEAIGTALKTGVLAGTNCVYQGAIGPLSEVVSGAYGTRADYVDAEDKAALVFKAADGTLHRYQVPAPIATWFMADGQTVAPSSAPLTAFVAALTAVQGAASPSSRSGSPFTLPTFIGGQRIRRRVQRKMTIWTLSGGLDEPAE